MNRPADATPSYVEAGSFGSWLAQARKSLRGNIAVEVPCGSCTGCCTSSYSVQLRPEDTRALSQIPVELLSSPPGFPAGHRTMRALANGHCPMLRESKCSIYRERPQTCRDYDCRVFTAAGIDAGGPEKAVINRRVHQWRFTYASAEERRAHDAVQAAARFIRECRSSFPSPVPASPMGIAVLAIKVYVVFLDIEAQTRPDAEIASAILEASRRFDAGAAI